MTDLKPCPCCPSGGEPTLMLNGSIQCLECGLFQHSGAVPWNTRPSPWYSVADRLPEPDVYVLTRVSGVTRPCILCHTLYVFGEGWRWDGWTTSNADSAVTHWMPLPLPPEDTDG
jgi:hypothetical protein